MVWTPLHAILGEISPVLDYALVERAVADRVSERTDLDWKRQLPLTAPSTNRDAKQAQQSELAKDIAAMANSGGGLIVFGVKESDEVGNSAAVGIRGVGVGAVNEDTTRDIRRVAGTLIYPPVVGLDLIHLTPAEPRLDEPGPTGAVAAATDVDSSSASGRAPVAHQVTETVGEGDEPGGGVLVLLVPDSADRPHLVLPAKGREWFAVPYRHGPDTAWMVERQIAAAYTERDLGRRRRVAEFDDRFDEFTASLVQDHNLRWVVAFAAPQTPNPRARALSPATAHDIIDSAWVSPLVDGFGPADLTRGETRRGLRRFTRTERRSISRAAPATARARVEIHTDGAVAVAFTRDGAMPGEGYQPTQVPVDDIERTGLHFVALLMALRARLGIVGDYAARLSVTPPTEIFRRPDSTLGGHYQPWDEQRIYGYRAVDGDIVATADRQTLLTSWVDLITDAVNQAGAPCSLDATTLAAALWD